MRFNDSIVGVVLVAFGAWVIFLTRDFPSLKVGIPGPALFPRILAGLLIIAGLVLFTQNFRSRRPLFEVDRTISHLGLLNVLFVCVAILGYILFVKFLGFLIVSFIILFGLMKCLRVRIHFSLIMASGITLFIYVLFNKFLLVPLPWGLWGWWI